MKTQRRNVVGSTVIFRLKKSVLIAVENIVQNTVLDTNSNGMVTKPSYVAAHYYWQR
jgi:hypothetical protein